MDLRKRPKSVLRHSEKKILITDNLWILNKKLMLFGDVLSEKLSG